MMKGEKKETRSQIMNAKPLYDFMSYKQSTKLFSHCFLS